MVILTLLIGGGIIYAAGSSGNTNRMSASSDQAIAEAVQPGATSNSPDTATPVQPVTEQPAPAAPAPGPSTAPGSYVDYSDSAVASTKGTRLLFFHAQWCPQCRALEADIKNKGVPAGVTILKVDYDSNQALRRQYGVTIQTTVVRIDDKGNLVERYVAYDDPTLAKVTENLL